MEDAVRDRLIDLNRRFYQTFAKEFSATRQRLQPGVLQVMGSIAGDQDVLDLGCGNGQLAAELKKRGHEGLYIGVDSNPDLLSIGREKLNEYESVIFLEKDLTTAAWADGLPADNFDFIMAFAVLHHVPSMKLRQELLRKIKSLMTPGGWFIHSEWQLLNSPRLRKRIQPWEKAGIRPDQVDEGDYLIDWRHGGEGLRYVHIFTESELEDLARAANFKIKETFQSDGEGGRLGLYQIWKGV